MNAFAGPIEQGAKAIANTIKAVPQAIPQPRFPEAVGYAFLGAYTLLVVATVIVYAMKRMRPERNYEELRLRIKTWWIIVVLTTFALGFNVYFSIFCVAFVSFLAFKEYLSLIPTRRADHRVLFWAYMAIPCQYLLAGSGWYGLFIIFIPVFWFLALPMRMVRPSTSVRSALRPSAKDLSAVMATGCPAARGKMVRSTARRCASFRSRTGSSVDGTHHTNAARRQPGWACASGGSGGSGSSAAGPWRVKRSKARPRVPPSSTTLPTQAVWP